MALFHKESCAICGNRVGADEKVKLDNGSVICNSCILRCGISNPSDKDTIKTMTIGEIKAKIEHIAMEAKLNRARIADFIPSQKVGRYIWFDDTHQWFTFPTFVSMKSSIDNSYIYRYDELVDYSVVEDEKTVDKGRVKGAVIGTVLLGPVGGFLGVATSNKQMVCTSLEIKVYTNNPDKPNQTVTFITGEVQRETADYKTGVQFAQQAASIFQTILDQLQHKDAPSSYVGSPAEEIKKYKELLDIGALTQEEFNAKKKELLNLKYRKDYSQNKSD